MGLFTRREILVSSRSDPSTPPPVIPSVSPPHPRLSLFICTSFSWKLERSDPAHSRPYHRLLSSYSWPRSTLSLHQWHVGPYSPTGGPQCSRLYRFAWLWVKVKGMPVLSGQCPGEKMRSCYPGAETAHHHNCSHSYNTSRDAQAEETLMRGWLLLTNNKVILTPAIPCQMCSTDTWEHLHCLKPINWTTAQFLIFHRQIIREFYSTISRVLLNHF